MTEDETSVIKMKLSKSSLETCQLTQEKKILETRHFSGREKAITKFSKAVRKLTCRQV